MMGEGWEVGGACLSPGGGLAAVGRGGIWSWASWKSGWEEWDEGRMGPEVVMGGEPASGGESEPERTFGSSVSLNSAEPPVAVVACLSRISREESPVLGESTKPL